MFHRFVLHLVMVNLVCIVGPLPFPPINIIVGLLVVIFCYQVIGIIHKLLLVMVEVVFVLVQPTSPPRTFFEMVMHNGGFNSYHN